MFTTKVRFLIIGVAAILFGYTLFQQSYQLVALVGLLIGYLIWSYFKQGTVALASKAFHNKDYAKAEILLKEIRDPDRLARNRRGYYEFIYGNIELQRENFPEAERHFQIASRFPLRTENDKALVLVQLANLSLRRREFDKAGVYVNKAKELKISSRVNNIIQKIEHEIQKSK